MKVWTLEEIDMLERSAFEAGEAVATERIIKLLEPLTICDEDCDHYNCGTWALKQGIALIKVEK